MEKELEKLIHDALKEDGYDKDITTLAIVDPKTKKATRVGYKVEAGKKVRVAKKSGAEI